jgi:hypothetical protein
MKVNTYRLLEECIERGIRGGLMNEDRDASLEFIIERYVDRVMNEVCEYFSFNGDCIN